MYCVGFSFLHVRVRVFTVLQVLADQCAAALQPSRASFCIVLVLGCHARVSNEDIDTVRMIRKIHMFLTRVFASSTKMKPCTTLSSFTRMVCVSSVEIVCQKRTSELVKSIDLALVFDFAAMYFLLFFSFFQYGVVSSSPERCFKFSLFRLRRSKIP